MFSLKGNEIVTLAGRHHRNRHPAGRSIFVIPVSASASTWQADRKPIIRATTAVAFHGRRQNISNWRLRLPIACLWTCLASCLRGGSIGRWSKLPVFDPASQRRLLVRATLVSWHSACRSVHMNLIAAPSLAIFLVAAFFEICRLALRSGPGARLGQSICGFLPGGVVRLLVFRLAADIDAKRRGRAGPMRHMAGIYCDGLCQTKCTCW